MPDIKKKPFGVLKSDQNPPIDTSLNSVDDFLQGIAKNESSDKFNVTHQPVPGKMHKGGSAVGKYGLMPVTVANLMDKRILGDAPEDPSLPVGTSPDQVIDVATHEKDYYNNANYMADQLRDSHEGQEVLANQFANLLLQKYGGDQDRAAYAWKMGPGRADIATADQINDPTNAGGDYVKKFRKTSAKLNPDVPQLEEESTKKVNPKSKKWKALWNK